MLFTTTTHTHNRKYTLPPTSPMSDEPPSTDISIYSYTRVARNGKQNVVYAVIQGLTDLDDYEFSRTVADIPYTRCLKTARRIAKSMAGREWSEHGEIAEINHYRKVAIGDDLGSFTISNAPEIQTFQTSFTDTPMSSMPPLPSMPPLTMPTAMPMPSNKWLLLSKIRDLEMALADARFQLQTIV